MASRLILESVQPSLDGNGDIIAGAKLLLFDADTLAAKAVYSDYTLGVSLGSTITASSGYFPDMWCNDTDVYRVEWRDASNALLDTFERIHPLSPDLSTEIDRAVKSPVGEWGCTLESVATRKGKMAAWHTTTGDLISATVIGEIAVVGVLGVDKGGTGLTSPGASGNQLVSNGVGWDSIPAGTAVAALSTALSTEVVTRGSSDVSLTSSVSTEISLRASADTSLSTAVSTATSIRASADTSLNAAVSTEISIRTSADTSLSTSAASEASVRASADTSLAAQIGGKIDLVSTVNASAASNVAFTGLASTYAYYILVSGNLHQSAVTNLKMQVSTDNGSTWDSAAKYASQGNRMAGSLLYFGQNSQTSFDIAEYITNSGSGKNFLNMEIYGANDATCHFKAHSRAGYSNVVATNGKYFDMVHVRADLTAVNAIKLYAASGTITGDFYLYGVKK